MANKISTTDIANKAKRTDYKYYVGDGGDGTVDGTIYTNSTVVTPDIDELESKSKIVDAFDIEWSPYVIDLGGDDKKELRTTYDLIEAITTVNESLFNLTQEDKELEGNFVKLSYVAGFTGTSTGNNKKALQIFSYTIPTKQYVDNIIEVADALHYCGTFTPAITTYTADHDITKIVGTWQDSGKINTADDENTDYDDETGYYPTFNTYVTAGSVYKISCDGWFASAYAHANDMLISYSDTTTKNAPYGWNLLQTHTTFLMTSGFDTNNKRINQRVINNFAIDDLGNLTYTYTDLTVEFHGTALDKEIPNNYQILSNIGIEHSNTYTDITYEYATITYSTNSTYGLILGPMGDNNNYQRSNVVDLTNNTANADGTYTGVINVITGINVIDGRLSYTYDNIASRNAKVDQIKTVEDAKHYVILKYSDNDNNENNDVKFNKSTYVYSKPSEEYTYSNKFVTHHYDLGTNGEAFWGTLSF